MKCLKLTILVDFSKWFIKKLQARLMIAKYDINLANKSSNNKK